MQNMIRKYLIERATQRALVRWLRQGFALPS
jgi:hypothetical protein